MIWHELMLFFSSIGMFPGAESKLPQPPPPKKRQLAPPPPSYNPPPSTSDMQINIISRAPPGSNKTTYALLPFSSYLLFVFLPYCMRTCVLRTTCVYLALPWVYTYTCVRTTCTYTCIYLRMHVRMCVRLCTNAYL